ncbi:hypothetical protein B0H19DRAFT_142681 [Mycena capillaripes]|nr:hypothetical protein B0H19DRAFT_142681 [Mycena capillaripes]
MPHPSIPFLHYSRDHSLASARILPLSMGDPPCRVRPNRCLRRRPVSLPPSSPSTVTEGMTLCLVLQLVTLPSRLALHATDRQSLDVLTLRMGCPHSQHPFHSTSSASAPPHISNARHSDPGLAWYCQRHCTRSGRRSRRPGAALKLCLHT